MKKHDKVSVKHQYYKRVSSDYNGKHGPTQQDGG